ncbi:MAG: hypothetical protein HGA45_36170 [Chloroflexales bacterium]|nr:hypothetical protein [Chloroflexales bacterium]
MIRTHILDCHLPRSEADALNRESGRVYTDVLVWHYASIGAPATGSHKALPKS